MKRSTESHLKLACERLQELQVSSALSVANIKEMQAEMVTTMKKSKELSDAVLKRRGQGLQDLRDKIAETNKKLEELQSKENANDKLSALQTEVVIINKQLKELSGNVPNDEKLSEFHDAINKLQTLMPRINSQLQDLRSEVAWTNNETNKKLKKLQEAITRLEKQNADPNVASCKDHIRVLDQIKIVEWEVFEWKLQTQNELRDLRENVQRDKWLLKQYSTDQKKFRFLLFFFFTILISFLFYYFNQFTYFT